MSLLKEFKEFAVKGNVVDLAVGIVIGAAFGKIVSSFVANIIMPLVGFFAGGADFTKMNVVLGSAIEGQDPITLNYGLFIQTVFDFTIIAFAIFMAVKVINNMKKAEEPEAEEEKPAEPSEEVQLLREIRDNLSK